MKKIKTIFKRDWEGNHKVINEYIDGFDPEILKKAIATEKADGTNVRITVRNKTIVRLEKRCNPSKLQKAKGIEDPWYVDADRNDPGDQYIWEATYDFDASSLADGEYSAEAIGPKIQGNKLELTKHELYLFSVYPKSILNAAISYDELKEWLPKQKSLINPEVGIEGIVWHCQNGEMFKIKLKDF